MGRSQCCVGGCNNVPGHGVSLHTFPKDEIVCRMWVKAIQMTRSDCSRVEWNGSKSASPNAQLVCSQHFELSMFTLTTITKWKLGIAYRPVLIDGAKPTLFGENVRMSNLENETPPRPVVRKLEVPRIVKDFNQQLLNVHGETPAAVHDLPEVDINKTEKCPCEKSGVTTSVKGCQVNIKPPAIKQKRRGTQTLMRHSITHSSSSTQYSVSDMTTEKTTVYPDVSIEPPQTPILASTPARKQRETPYTESLMSMSPYGMNDDENLDPDYEPEASFTSEPEHDERNKSNIRDQRKFLVFEENLLELFQQCQICHHATEGTVCNIQGSYVAIRQECDCGHTRRWESQPKVNNVPAGNILLSAGILFSGCSPTKVLRIFSFINFLSISLSTFFKHQRTVLWSAIERVWTKTNTELISSLQSREDELVVAGDGRADSPGHSAKFGVYSMIDMTSGKVIALELVQSNEVKSSYHMELEGLRRIIDRFHGHGLSFGEIITDRHLQIQKWIRDTLPGTVHSFDVWHIGKAVKKKVLALSKLKDCTSVSKWMKSITNHLYWAAASSRGQEGVMIEAKWTSVVNHVQNIHTGHGDLYNTCDHGQIHDREWLVPGSKAAVKLEDILINKRLCSAIQKVSTGFQTSTLEAFHSVINHFAPKMMAYSYHGQMCRQYLAALHFNENVKREKRMGIDRTLYMKAVFPKYKNNDEFSVKFVNEEMTFHYVEDLLDMTLHICGEVNSIVTSAPPPLTSGKRKPTKVEITKCLASMCKKLKY